MKKYKILDIFTEIQSEYLDTENCKLPFVLCTCGEYKYQTATNRPEGYMHHHLIWVTKGEGIFETGNGKVVLSEGEGLFCKKGVAHSYRASGECFQTAWLTFLCSDVIFEHFRTEDSFVFKVTPAFADFAADVRSSCFGNSTVFTRSAAGYSGLIRWLTELKNPTLPRSVMIRRYMEVNFALPLTLDDIAKYAGMSRFTLCRYYKSEYGITVIEQLKQIRIEKAKKMLRHTQYKVEEIGRLCGFESASYFGKLFKLRTGQTPKDYRER